MNALLLLAAALSANAQVLPESEETSVRAENSTRARVISVGGVGHGEGKKDAATKNNTAAGGKGGSGGGGGSAGGGGKGAAAPPASQPPSQPPWENMTLTVTCGATKNELRWLLRDGRNSNSLLRSVDGGGNAYVCGGPANIAPCVSLNVDRFTDNNVQPGKVYKYTHKSAPAIASNVVTCPKPQ